MLTILAVLEKGYESSFEHLAFRQLKHAYGCKLVCVPHDFPTMEEALANTPGRKIFMVPPGRVEHSSEFSNFIEFLGEDMTFVFGSPQDSLVQYIQEDDTALHITTEGSADMMAVCVAAQVLYVFG